MNSKNSKGRPNELSERITLLRPERPVLSVFKRIRKNLLNFWETIRSQFSDDPLDRCRWIRLPSSLKNTSNKPKDQLGRAGEEEAVFFLQEKGYIILQQNIRLPGTGEIDLIARKGRTLVFFEIKTRRDSKVGKPDEAVTTARKKRLVAKAGEFQQYCRMKDIAIRFDIISVVWPEDRTPEIEHIENAFHINDYV